MPFWNPKSYNPQMGQFGLNLMQGGLQNQSMGPAQGLANMLQMILGGAISGGQRKARTRAEEETSSSLAEILSRERQQGIMPTFSKGPMPFGMSNMPTGARAVGEDPIKFANKKQQDKIKTLMKSEIPEYRQAGVEMMLKSMQAKSPEYKFLNTPDGVAVANPQTGRVELAYQADKPLDLKQFDNDKAIWSVDEEAGTMTLVAEATEPPMPKAPTHRKAVYNGVNVNEDWNGEKWVVTSQAPESKGVTVNTGDMPGVPKGAQSKIWIARDEAERQLASLKDLESTFKKEYFEIPNRAAAGLQGIKERLGPWGEIIPTDFMNPENMGERQVFISKTWIQANAAIRALTGAQMTVKEVPRLMQGIFNPADDPITAWAKLQTNIAVTERLVKHYASKIDGGATEEEAGASTDALAEQVKDAYAEMDRTGNWDMAKDLIGFNMPGLPRDDAAATTVSQSGKPPKPSTAK